MTRLDEAPCAYLSIDEDRAILDANKEAARLFDRPREELIGKKLSPFLPIASRIFFHTHVYPELAARGRVDEFYLTVGATGGEEVPVLMTGRRTERGDSHSYDFVLLPIRRRTIFERELASAKESAERASRAARDALSKVRDAEERMTEQDRLTTLGTLAAGIVHEINNPLAFVANTVEVAVEMLERSETLTEAEHQDVLDLLRDAHEGTDRIRDIVRVVQSVSRRSTLPTRVDLESVVNAAMRITGHTLRTRSQVVLDIERPAPSVIADEGRLVQVVVNLLVNAAQAMPDRPTTENRITVRVARGGESALVEVGDNGSGILPELRSRIFEPFFTTKPVGVGTGLGLPVCRDIVGSLGGSLSLESELDRGTTFRIVLPIAVEEPPV